MSYPTNDASRYNDFHNGTGVGGGQFSSGPGGGGGGKPPAKKPAAHKPASHKPTHHSGHPAPHKPAGPLTTTLAFDGKRGPGYGVPGGEAHVHAAQQALNRLGLADMHGKSLRDDGELGPKTTASIKALQKRLGLHPDGKLTPALYTKLIGLKTLPPASAHKAAPHKPAPAVHRGVQTLHEASTEKLHEYWVHGEGAAQIGWGSPGDFDRCTALLEAHAKMDPEQAHGYCNLAHHSALGYYPATHAAMDKGHRAGTLDRFAAVRAELAAADVNNLPDSAFAYIEPGGTKDAEGKTTPRSLRHFPIHDVAHVRAALARAPQSPFGEKAMPKIRAAATKYGVTMSDQTASRADDLTPWPALLTRSFPLSDVDIRRGKVTCESCGQDATGRMVDHYVAPFGEQTEVHDGHGDYIEELDPAAFNKRLADLSRSSSGVRGVNVFYNHAKTLYDTPSEQWSVPVGHPAVLRADGRGLFGSTHYSRDESSERILQGVLDGNIAGHSFTGRIVRSNPDRVPRRARSGDLPLVRRLELGLTEYGPTPIPYYVGTQMVAARSQLSDQHSGLEPLATTPPLPSGAGAETPDMVHVGRQADLARRIRVARLTRGLDHGGFTD
jgi:phage head maturation protease